MRHNDIVTAKQFLKNERKWEKVARETGCATIPSLDIEILLNKYAKIQVETMLWKIINSAQKVYQVSPLSNNKLIGQSEIAQIGENYLKEIK